MSTAEYPEYLAFGDISIDVGVKIPHLPQPDEKLFVETIGEFPGGMAANAASAYTALGGRGAVVATIGPDRFGQIALKELMERGVDVRSVRQCDDPTFWTLALLTPDGEKSLIQFNSPAISANWTTFDWSLLEKASFVHAIPDDEAHVLDLFVRARKLGLTTSLDFEGSFEKWPNHEKVLSRTSILFINRMTASRISTDLRAAAHGFQKMGAETVIITLGDKGCFVLESSGDAHQVMGHKVTALDTTGAGDCFAGAFAYGWKNGWPALVCAQLANLVAAHSTTAYGSRGRLLSAGETARLAAECGYEWWERLS